MALRELTFRDYIGKFLLISLFLVAILSFSSIISSNYGYSSSSFDSEELNITELENEVNDINSQAEAWENVFKSDNLFIALGGIVLFSLWGVMNLIWTATFGLSNIILGLMSSVLGVPPIVTGTIITLIILALIFLAWRTIKQGE